MAAALATAAAAAAASASARVVVVLVLVDLCSLRSDRANGIRQLATMLLDLFGDLPGLQVQRTATEPRLLFPSSPPAHRDGAAPPLPLLAPSAQRPSRASSPPPRPQRTPRPGHGSCAARLRPPRRHRKRHIFELRPRFHRGFWWCYGVFLLLLLRRRPLRGPQRCASAVLVGISQAEPVDRDGDPVR